MSNQVSINLNDVVHLAISGSSGSGKSYFLEYLIRCIRKITDDIVAVDPKRADIYSLDFRVAFVGVSSYDLPH